MISNSSFPTSNDRAKLASSGIAVASSAMNAEWLEFMRMFDTIREAGVRPYFHLIANYLGVFMRSVYKCYSLYGVGSRFATLPVAKQRRIENKISSFIRLSVDIYEETLVTYDVDEIIDKMELTITEFEELLTKAMPSSSQQNSDAMRSKVDLRSSVGDLKAILKAAKMNTQCLNDFSDDIVMMHDSINNTLENFGLLEYENTAMRASSSQK